MTASLKSDLKDAVYNPLGPSSLDASTQAIRRILSDWDTGKYDVQLPLPPLLAFTLSENYSKSNIQCGSLPLKGSDAVRFSSLLTIAKEIGFVVCLADITTDAEDNDEDQIRAGELSCMVRISDGEMLRDSSFDLSGKNIIYHKIEPPARESYDGDNEDIVLDDDWSDYTYSALVFYRARDETNITLATSDLHWAVGELKGISNPPTARAQVIVSFILKKCRADPWDQDQSGIAEGALSLVQYAVAIKDAELWKDAFRYCIGPPKSYVDAARDALAAFDLASICPGIEALITHPKAPCKRFEAARALDSGMRGDMESKWTMFLINEMKKSYSGGIQDIPGLIQIAQTMGLESIQSMLNIGGENPAVKHPEHFLMLFAEALHKNRAELQSPTYPATRGGQAPAPSLITVDVVISQCLEAIFNPCAAVLAGADKALIYREGFRVSQLVGFSIRIGDVGLSKNILASVIQTRDSSLFISLSPKLRGILEMHRIDVATEPFRTFYRNLISVYLAHILGPAPPTIPSDLITCDCAECTELGKFICDKSRHQWNLRIHPGPPLAHLEEQVARADVARIISHEVQRNKKPHRFIATKLLSQAKIRQWYHRQKEATKFIDRFGEEMLDAIMGDRKGDVAKALQGTQAFVPVENVIPPVATGSAPQEVGVKRKRAETMTEAGGRSNEQP